MGKAPLASAVLAHAEHVLMRAYRCYLLNASRRIVAMEVVSAETDVEAMVQAVGMLAGRREYRGVEVWDGARRILPKDRKSVDLAELKAVLRAVGISVTDEPSTGAAH